MIQVLSSCVETEKRITVKYTKEEELMLLCSRVSALSQGPRPHPHPQHI